MVKYTVCLFLNLLPVLFQQPLNNGSIIDHCHNLTFCQFIFRFINEQKYKLWKKLRIYSLRKRKKNDYR